MKPSPLLLERIFFTKVHFESVQLDKGLRPEGKALEYALDCKVAYTQRAEEKNKFLITLTVELKDGSESNRSPFVGEIMVDGYFVITDEVKRERWIEVATANGAAVLFGAVRELLTTLTARSPHPRLMLPSVNFIDEAIQFQAKANAEQAALDAPATAGALPPATL